MSKRKLPTIQNFELPKGLEAAPDPDAVDKYRAHLKPAVQNAAGVTVINILDEIGQNPWTGEGITVKQVSDALAGAGDVVVNINSPGGDFSVGTSIYSLLAMHKGEVTVNVLGMAASAASIIAMAGDTIRMALPALMMIHNGWTIVLGDRHDMADAAAVLAKIDASIGAVYAARTGKSKVQIETLMDEQTWFTAEEAIAAGFADVKMNTDEVLDEPAAARAAHPMNAIRRADAIFAHAGLPRRDRRSLMAELKASVGAPRAGVIEQDAVPGSSSVLDALSDLKASLAERPVFAAAADWQCSASRTLAIDTSDAWDGAGATKRMLDDAGFDGSSPDFAKARRGFLAHDQANPSKRSSYKLPFADIVGGELKAVAGGIRAAASRLPQTDIPQPVKDEARQVIDHYEERIRPSEKNAPANASTKPGAGDAATRDAGLSGLADDLRGLKDNIAA